MRCARCDWQSTPDLDQPPRQQAADHARDAHHPLCVVCSSSLTQHEPQTCEGCLTTARENLAGIVTMYLELPRHLGHLRPIGYASSHGGGDGRPLPGGDALVLLSGGSEGGAPRKLTSGDLRAPERWWVKGATGPLSQAALMAAERERTGREHQVDNRPSDAQPVSDALGTWALEWQEERGESEQLGHRPADIVLAAAGYLERRCRWAANSHPAFDEFAADLTRLHQRLEVVTGRSERPIVAEADCFECSGALERLVTEQGECRCPARPSMSVRAGESVADRDARLRAWDEGHGRCNRGGADDHFTCRRCGRRHSWQSYLLALRAKLEEAS
ncbi:MAG: hypothetical protein JWM02_3670 [Frankiales bacterium]|nr:hypothetical protein [Frankiales bacterium]